MTVFNKEEVVEEEDDDDDDLVQYRLRSVKAVRDE